VGSRRLKFNGFRDICHGNLPTIFKRRLSPENVSFPQLSEREFFGPVDGNLELFSVQYRVEPPVIRYPNRFRDADGAATWDKIFAIVNELEDSDPSFSSSRFQQLDPRSQWILS
jgi:hypothetical protein